MGGLLILALWTALQIARRKSFVTRQNSKLLLPLLVYLGWNIICFACAPLHLEAAEEFIRFILYIAITLLAATEFTPADIKTLTRWLLGAVWISLAYGTVQIIDGFFPGVDPMPWRGFFTKRIFSTHANPNFLADFIVFTSCLVGSMYLLTRQKKYIVLAALGAVSLFFTESKGAWLAYAFAVTLFIILYTNYAATSLKKYRTRLNVCALVGVLAAVILVGVYTSKRFQSVSFRTHTWLGALEIVKEHPVMGVGIGNFKTIYSAHRRPQIFYIESSHNTETQHAENELIEQAAVSGVVGLAVFLWLLGAVLLLALRTLRQAQPDEERKLYLIGYTTAFAAMTVHSLVDISIHFASSGFFFALFMGLIIALCCPPQNAPAAPAKTPAWVLLLERGILIVAALWLTVWLFAKFHEITAVLGTKTLGDVLLISSAWVMFISIVFGACFVLVKSAWKLKSALALAVLILLVPLEFLAYCPFQANHYYSLAISFNNLRNMDGAIEYFTKAIRFNPLQSEYRQFRANVFTAVLDLDKRFSPLRGDTTTAQDDFTRAKNDFAVVMRRSPNHPLLYHNQGQLYYKMALLRSDQSGRARSRTEHELFKQEALDNMAQAKAAFERSLQSDPVNPETYMYLVQIGLLENNLDDAQRWLDAFYQGPKGVTEEEFLTRNRNFPPAAQLQAQINARRQGKGLAVK